MEVQNEYNDEARRERLAKTSTEHKLKKEQKKQRRKYMLKIAVDEFIHQIKIMLLFIVILAVVILLLCSSAWYILENEKKQSIAISETYNMEEFYCNKTKEIYIKNPKIQIF